MGEMKDIEAISIVLEGCLGDATFFFQSYQKSSRLRLPKAKNVTLKDFKKKTFIETELLWIIYVL